LHSIGFFFSLKLVLKRQLAALDSWLVRRASEEDTKRVKWIRLGSGRNGGTLKQHDGMALLVRVCDAIHWHAALGMLLKIREIFPANVTPTKREADIHGDITISPTTSGTSPDDSEASTCLMLQMSLNHHVIRTRLPFGTFAV